LKTIIKIRPARNHDARKIYEFLCEKEEFLFDFREFEFNYRVCIANGDNIYLVAVNEQNDATGFISCHGGTVLHEGGVVYEIKELFIEKKFRKTGIAKVLLRQLLESLSQRIFQSLEVAIEREENELIGFYEGGGFEQKQIKLIHSKAK
jgi:ribosomal protein S18 acetylase RimI-like enzyme